MCETLGCHHEHQAVLQNIEQQHRHEVHAHLGAACCSGQCMHPEHTQAAMLHNTLARQHEDEDDDDDTETSTTKKVRRQSYPGLLQLGNV